MATFDPGQLLQAIMTGGAGLSSSVASDPEAGPLPDLDAEELSLLDLLAEPSGGAQLPELTSTRPRLSSSLPAIIGDLLITLSNKGRAPVHTGFTQQVMRNAERDADRSDRLNFLRFGEDRDARLRATEERLGRVRRLGRERTEQQRIDRGIELDELRHERGRRESLEDEESRRVWESEEDRIRFGSRVAASMADAGALDDPDLADGLMEGDPGAIAKGLTRLSLARQKELEQTDPRAAEAMGDARSAVFSSFMANETGPSDVDAALDALVAANKGKLPPPEQIQAALQDLAFQMDSALRAFSIGDKDRDLLMDEWWSHLNRRVSMRFGSLAEAAERDQERRTKRERTKKQRSLNRRRARELTDPRERAFFFR